MTDVCQHAADRLLEAIDRVGSPVCVGLDPVFERLPAELRDRENDGAERIGEFCVRVIEAVRPHVPCVKIQSACFERYLGPGVTAMLRVIDAAHGAGLEVILDAKRGDIGISAEHYAAFAFGGAAFASGGIDTKRRADWLTINAYLGRDSIEPFLREGVGAFALVRTSNPGSDEVQANDLAAGGTVCTAVADMIASLGEQSIGERGYSALGAVVGATKPQDAAALRARMPHQIFLVPGFGAQGGTVEDIRPCFNEDGRGAIVTASRSVIYPFGGDDAQWMDAVREAARAMAEQVRGALSAVKNR